MRLEDKRVHVQIGLVVCNLKKVYSSFKDAFPSIRIGFSKFAELGFQHSIFTGASGTHCVSVSAPYIKISY